jgi:excinuclease ABC subunit C
MRDIAEIKDILKGDTRIVSELLMEQMQALAAEMKFEEAQKVKEKYELIENYRSKSQIVNVTIHNVDVFSIDTDEENAYINYLHIVNGCITQAFTFEYKKRMDETPEEILPLGIIEMRERYQSESKEIIVPFEIETPLKNVDFIVPVRGEKRQLLELSKMNVKQYKVDRLKQAEKLNPEQKVTRILKEIQEQLHLPKIPAHIECFDNSNISGSDAVAACVVFRMGKPSKKDYRKFNIKTVVGPDDYASMQEVVRRRYTRMVEEGESLPDLLITDGGKGQMEVVRQVIEDELHLNIPIAGLAKNDKHRTSELLYGFPPMTVGLKTTSPLFHLLERIQDEVHRFAITFHRDKRSKSQVASVLDTIPGIGTKRKQDLLKAFKSVARIRQASEEEVAKVIGPKAAQSVMETLNKGKENEK